MRSFRISEYICICIWSHCVALYDGLSILASSHSGNASIYFVCHSACSVKFLFLKFLLTSYIGHTFKFSFMYLNLHSLNLIYFQSDVLDYFSKIFNQLAEIVRLLWINIDKAMNFWNRGRAEQEPRISIPVPAVPVSELLAGKKTENL